MKYFTPEHYLNGNSTNGEERLDRRGQCWFDVLLSNGWSMKLPVSDFSYSIGEQLLPSGNGDRAGSRTFVGSAG
jgi:hypothetical protein